MPIARRKDDAVVSAGWLANISRFDLRDLSVLIGLIIWMVSLQFGGANDNTARASVADVKQAAAVHKEQADGRWNLILQRLDDLRAQNKELKEAILALNEKIDTVREKK